MSLPADGMEFEIEMLKEEVAELKRDRIIDRETAQTLLDLLEPLHGSLDKQTYDEKMSDNFNSPADKEYGVTVTAQRERDLAQAVYIIALRLCESDSDGGILA